MVIDHLYDVARNMHWYHLGFCNEPVYHAFYQWLRTVKLHYVYDDMPHDYFVFLEDDDRLDMHTRFAPWVSERHNSEIWLQDFVDCTAPVDTTTVEYTISVAANDAIVEEINREILEVIRTPPSQKD